MILKWLSILTLFVGCTHAQTKFETQLHAGSCDEALNNVPEEDASVKLLKQTEHAAKNAISYSYIGVNYSAEIIWDTVAGSVAFVALCSPAIVAIAASRVASSPPLSSDLCFPLKNIKGVLAPPLGRHAVRDTEELRCPDLGSLIHSLRAVAGCFESRGGQEDLARARASLMKVQDSAGFYSCFSSEEKNLMLSDLQRIDEKIRLLR